MIQAMNFRLKSLLPEYLTEIGMILVSLGLLAFFKLSEEVFEGDTASFDQRILLWFRNSADLSDPIGPDTLEVVVRDITALGGLFVLALFTLAACGYLWIRNRQRLALFIVVAVSGGSLVNTLLKGLFSRPRPDLVPHETFATLTSFPSGHAMMATVVYLTLGALLSTATDDRRIKLYILAWSVFLTVLVGVSRIYLGVHWPTDILAGWIAGAIWALLCLLIGQRILKSNQGRSDKPA